MGDYIKREDAIRAYAETLKSDKDTKIIAEMILADVPSADVVEVVRCRDCKWYDWVDCTNPIVTAFPNDVRDEDNYCNFGERKEQEHE